MTEVGAALPESFGRSIYVALIAQQMLVERIPPELAGQLSHLGRSDDGIYALMDLWSVEMNANERAKIIYDLKELIRSYVPPENGASKLYLGVT